MEVGGQDQETTETRGHGVKKLAHCTDPYHQLPEEHLLKLMVRVTDFRAMSMVLKAAEGKCIFRLVQNPQVTIEKSQ